MNLGIEIDEDQHFSEPNRVADNGLLKFTKH
ncbi:hypothetical protein [Limosilactobacillus albertensis]